MEKKEQDIRDLLDNYKRHNTHIMRIPEGEETMQQKKYLNNGREFSNINDIQISEHRNSENTKKDKCKNINTYSYHIQNAEKNQRQRENLKRLQGKKKKIEIYLICRGIRIKISFMSHQTVLARREWREM